MATFKPYRVTSSQLISLPIVNGQFIIVIDTKEMYDDQEGNRLLLSGELSQEEITEALGYIPFETVTIKRW